MATHSSILPGKFHGQRSLVGYSPQGHKGSDTTQLLSTQAPKLWDHEGPQRYELLQGAFKGSDSGRKDKGSFKLFLGWEAMSLCGQHSLGVHYNCIFQSSPTGFIIGGNMPLYSPSPDSGNQLSRLVHGDISVFSVYLGFNWYLEERTINGGCQMVTI